MSTPGFTSTSVKCFMLNNRTGGGGNPLSATVKPMVAPLTVRRTGAIGDALCSSVVADRLMELGFEVGMQTHPACHCVLRLHPRLSSLHESNGSFCHVDLDNAYEQHPHRRQRHYHSMFFEAAQRQLGSRGIDIGSPTNCRPRLKIPANRREATRAKLLAYPRPWVMICPRSDSFNVRQVPDGVWAQVAPRVCGSSFWIGRHPAPSGIVDLNCRHFDSVLDYLSVADLYLGVETGPMHVAAALGVPCVVIIQATNPEMTLSDQNDFIAISNGLECLHCQKTQCPKNAHLPPCQDVDPSLIAAWANARMHQSTTENISAVIAIYQPEPATLNRCLECVIPQVQEVIVTAEANSRIPREALRHPKVKYVQTVKRHIGYGRNANFGARHSNGKYILLMNDDCFLDPGAVENLRLEMKPGVAAVAHFLRYPNGQVYYAGKVRSPGMRGWGHVSHRQWKPDITHVMDAENLCGCSVLVRREAFYQVGGFDEDFFCYAEDDAFMLSLRKAGWKLTYTPHATGVHMEGQSTQKIGQPNELVRNANHIFNQKWGAYLTHNLHRVPGNFEYLKA